MYGERRAGNKQAQGRWECRQRSEGEGGGRGQPCDLKEAAVGPTPGRPATGRGCGLCGKEGASAPKPTRCPIPPHSPLRDMALGWGQDLRASGSWGPWTKLMSLWN